MSSQTVKFRNSTGGKSLTSNKAIRDTVQANQLADSLDSLLKYLDSSNTDLSSIHKQIDNIRKGISVPSGLNMTYSEIGGVESITIEFKPDYLHQESQELGGFETVYLPPI